MSQENFADSMFRDDQEYLIEIVKIFRNYENFCKEKIDKKRLYISRMRYDYRLKLEPYHEHLNCCAAASAINQVFFNKVVSPENGRIFSGIDVADPRLELRHAPRFNIDPNKLNTVMHQIVREWSIRGEEEREESFGVLLRAVDKCFSYVREKKKIRILVPGAGLGRLVFELVVRGYSAEGNEYSPMMLFTANYILNKVHELSSEQILPYLLDSCNTYSNSQLERVYFPDVYPKMASFSRGDFSMSAGAFLDTYHDSKWNCVVTCFFLDTAKNVLEYVERIHQILLPHSLWINLGPLDYHYASSSGEDSIEPNYEQLKDIIKSFGFKFIEEETRRPTRYTQNRYSMIQYVYNSAFFICKKCEQI